MKRSKSLKSILLFLSASLLGPALVEASGEPTVVRRFPPMHVAVVQLSDPACGQNCPKWISAEGEITDEAPWKFHEVLRETKEQRLPVFINSNGGSIIAALEIGQMLHEANVDVAVATTKFDGCAPEQDACSRDRLLRGRPSSFNAYCLSACPYLIAGAKRRFIAPVSIVGVHQIGLIPEVHRNGQVEDHFNTTRASPQAGEQIEKFSKEYVKITDYLNRMSVSSTLVLLSYRARYEHMSYLSRKDMKETRLVTDEGSAEKMVGLPAPGVKEYAVPKLAQTGEMKPYSSWLTEIKKSNAPIPNSILQLRIGGTDHSPIMLIIAFSVNDNDDLITWRASALRDGDSFGIDYSTLSLETKYGVAIPPTVLESSIYREKSDSGTIPLETFCRLDGPVHAKITFVLTTKGTHLPLHAEREALPWVDRGLLDHCTPVGGAL